MKHYFTLHLDAAKHALRQLFKQPFSTLLILLMLAIAMSLPLALYLGIQSSQAVLGKLNESPKITLYLAANAEPDHISEIKNLLGADKRLTASEFIGKTQGLDELQKLMGSQDLVSMLDENPLPDVFVATPQNGLSPDEMQKLKADLTQLPMVEKSELDTEWMQTLYQIDDFVKKVLLFLAVTLSVAFVLVAHNTIRLQILSRKEEIEITKLLGAPSSFIRRPFLYQAMWQSLLAAGISMGLCAWVVEKTRPLVSQIFEPYGLNIRWRMFYPEEIWSVLAIVAVLGLCGAWLATTQHLLYFKAKKQ